MDTWSRMCAFSHAPKNHDLEARQNHEYIEDDQSLFSAKVNHVTKRNFD